MNRSDWLRQLKNGDRVEIFVLSQSKGVATVDHVTKTLVVIGKYGKAKRFSRTTGVLCGRKPLKHLFRLEMPK